MTELADQPLETVRHEPAEVDSAIIWLHGLGADAHDFEPLMPELNLATTRYIFPNAPVRPVTINGGMRMRAWYDFPSMEFSRCEEPEDIDTSIEAIHDLMDEQVALGIRANRLILAGFSQGGVIALLAALTYKQPVATVLALSTYLPQQAIRTSWPQQPPVLQCHGSHDPIIPLALAKASCDAMVGSGITVEFHEYPMAHQVCAEEITAIKEFLQKHLE